MRTNKFQFSFRGLFSSFRPVIAHFGPRGPLIKNKEFVFVHVQSS
jgi:hypothetical protein